MKYHFPLENARNKMCRIVVCYINIKKFSQCYFNLKFLGGISREINQNSLNNTRKAVFFKHFSKYLRSFAIPSSRSDADVAYKNPFAYIFKKKTILVEKKKFPFFCSRCAIPFRRIVFFTTISSMCLYCRDHRTCFFLQIRSRLTSQF